MKIKAWKGGRTDRVYARITPQAKKKLLARIKLEGFTTLADWIESEAKRSPTKRAADECPTCAGLGFVNDKRGRRGVDCSDCNGSGIRR